MARAVGIPARVAAGFSEADWNPIGRFYAVRKRSAHSWSEAFLDGRWVTVDPTPPVPEGFFRRTPSGMMLFIEAMRMQWYKRVIGYDVSSQFEIAWRFRYLYRTTLKKAVGWVRVPGLSQWPAAALVAAIGIAIGLALWHRRQRIRSVRRRDPSGARRRERNEASGIYRRFERRLARLGYQRPPTRTPAEQLRALVDAPSAVREAAERITTRYHQVRFGGDRFDRGEVEGLRRVIRRMGKS